MTKRTKAEKRLRRELGVAWFLSAAADTASYAPKLVFGAGAERGHDPDNPKHQKYLSETQVSSLLANVPEFVVQVWGPNDIALSAKPRLFKVTVEEVTT